MIVLGLGQPSAGDDAVGLAVVARLRGLGVAAELRTASCATALVEALGEGPVVLVDALVDGTVGAVRVLPAARLEGAGAASTHGLSVPAAVGLAEALHGPVELAVVGVTIAPPGPGVGLNAAVAAAVDPAAAAVRGLVEGGDVPRDPR